MASFVISAKAIVTPQAGWAKEYLTAEQARQIMFGDLVMEPLSVVLTHEQRRSIRNAAKVRVRYPQMTTWRSEKGHWFILDQVIGKHENIDMAVGFLPDGAVAGIEILTYRETYGYEIMNPKWRAQFHGKNHSYHLRLDREIKNISGATLSCRHVTDGINRLTQTWLQVLQYLPDSEI